MLINQFEQVNGYFKRPAIEYSNHLILPIIIKIRFLDHKLLMAISINIKELAQV